VVIGAAKALPLSAAQAAPWFWGTLVPAALVVLVSLRALGCGALRSKARWRSIGTTVWKIASQRVGVSRVPDAERTSLDASRNLGRRGARQKLEPHAPRASSSARAGL